MSAQSFEVILARLYTDPGFRNQFLNAPEVALQYSDLSDSEKVELIAIDKAGLLMASHSFLRKRKKRFFNRPRPARLTAFFKKLVALTKGLQ